MRNNCKRRIEQLGVSRFCHDLGSGSGAKLFDVLLIDHRILPTAHPKRECFYSTMVSIHQGVSYPLAFRKVQGERVEVAEASGEWSVRVVEEDQELTRSFELESKSNGYAIFISPPNSGFQQEKTVRFLPRSCRPNGML